MGKGVDEQEFLNEQRRKLLQECVATEKTIRKCEYCKKIFNKRIHYSQHIKTCKFYAKFLEKTSIGFDCLICLNQRTTTIYDMYRHIRDRHSDDLNFKKNKKEMESIDSSKESMILQNANNVLSTGERDPLNHLNSKNMGLEIKGRITRTMKRSGHKTNIKDNLSIDEIGKFKCNHCDMVTNSAPNFSRHMKGCKFYSKFFSITNAGLQCLLCSINFTGDSKGREYIRQHIRKIHFNNIDFKEVEEVMEKSETPEMNSKSNEGKIDNRNDVIKKNIKEVEKSENPEIIKDSKNLDEEAELRKTYISRSKLFKENNTESQNVMECEYCGGDFVNKIHLKFCQMASKYVMKETCLICDSVSDSSDDAIKHVREHHLDVICEFIESENSEKSSDYTKIKNANVNLLSKIDTTNQQFEIQNHEKLLRNDYQKLYCQSNHEIKDWEAFIKESHGNTTT